MNADFPFENIGRFGALTSFCTISYVPGVGFAVLPNVYWEARLDTNDGASAGSAIAV